VAGGIALVLSRYATRNTVVLIASLIAIDVFIVGSWFGVEKTVQRIEQTTTQQVEDRQLPTQRALNIVRDYPVFGSGGGTFAGAFMRYRGPEIRAFYDHVENDYTQFLAETGVLGAVLIGCLPVMALWLAILALARRRDPLARGFAFGALMGIVAIGIHSTVDFNLQIPANAFLFMVLLAFAWIAYYLDRGVK
jgi:O-antigen ligase